MRRRPAGLGGGDPPFWHYLRASGQVAITGAARSSTRIVPRTNSAGSVGC